MTQSVYSCLLQSEKFIDGEYLHKVCAAKHIEIFRDEDELTTWHKIGDPVLHI